MNTPPCTELPAFEIRFASLFRAGSGYAFPCDVLGRVVLDDLSEKARMNYYYARAMVGRDVANPRVCALAAADPCVR